MGPAKTAPLDEHYSFVRKFQRRSFFSVVHMFYHRCMATSPTTAARNRLADVHALRSKLERMQGPRLGAPAIPVHPLLADLLPGRGLQPGWVYSVPSSPSLLLALLATPSHAGSWTAAIGMPDLGVEAAALAGVALERLVLIPSPGPRMLAVTAAVVEVLPVVALRPREAPRDSDASRLAARLRDRGAVLLVDGPWPQADALLTLEEPRWSGIGAGHGYLTSREVTVTVTSRRSPLPSSARMLLPGPGGGLTELPRTLQASPLSDHEDHNRLDYAAEPARLREAG